MGYDADDARHKEEDRQLAEQFDNMLKNKLKQGGKKTMSKITDFEIKGVAREIKQNDIDDFSVGFVGADSKWYNLHAKEPEAVEEMKQTILQKGNVISFENTMGIASDITLIKKAEAKKDNWQDDMVNFEDLLASAHEKAKSDSTTIRIETEIITDGAGNPFVDYKEKHALFRATVTILDAEGHIKQVFDGHGDAEGIDTEVIQKHFIRMAETRAIARALRWYTNNAKCTDVEASK